MMDTEAFREFKTGLTLLRDNYANKALPHMRRAVDLEKNNPYYMSYLGVVLARSEQKWGEAEKLCDSAVRMKRNQAQLYLNLAEVYATAGRRDDAMEALQAGLKYARRDVRLTIAMNKLTQRRSPILAFLGRKHPLNRQLGILRHRALRIFGQASYIHLSTPKRESGRPDPWDARSCFESLSGMADRPACTNEGCGHQSYNRVEFLFPSGA